MVLVGDGPDRLDHGDLRVARRRQGGDHLGHGPAVRHPDDGIRPDHRQDGLGRQGRHGSRRLGVVVVDVGGDARARQLEALGEGCLQLQRALEGMVDVDADHSAPSRLGEQTRDLRPRVAELDGDVRLGLALDPVERCDPQKQLKALPIPLNGKQCTHVRDSLGAYSKTLG